VRSRRRIWLGRAIRYGFFLAVIVFAFFAVRSQYAEVSKDVSRLSIASIIGVLCAVGASLWFLMLSWRRILTDLGSHLHVSSTARVFFIGQLGKYLPGSVWPVLAQVELARAYQVPRARTAATAIVSTFLNLVGALIVAAALLPLAVKGTGWRLVLIAGLIVSLIIASPPFLNRILGLGLRLVRRNQMEIRLSARGTIVAIGYAAAAWVMQGLGVYALSASIGDGLRLLPLSIAIYAAASALGIVVVIAPAGLGVREPVIVAGLTGQLTAGGALFVALAIRLAVTLVDLLAGGIVAAIPAWQRFRQGSPAPQPPPAFPLDEPKQNHHGWSASR
jgi:uncharacterized membrane protein YbhN (UPF0104 family)